MLTASIRWVGDTQWIAKMVQRAGAGQMEAAVFRPWERAVLQRDVLDLYRSGGGTPPWAPNAAATIEAKGHARPMLSARLYQFGTMVRSYQIVRKRRGLRVWDFELTNRARSEKGYDYPSLLHRGTYPGHKPAIPARAHMGFQPKSIQRLLDAAPRWVLEGRRYGT